MGPIRVEAVAQLLLFSAQGAAIFRTFRAEVKNYLQKCDKDK
jgi:hypothetical protein